MNSVLERTVADCHPVSVPDYTPVAQLRDLQIQRLQAVVTRAWQHVQLFRDRMDERGGTDILGAAGGNGKVP